MLFLSPYKALYFKETFIMHHPCINWQYVYVIIYRQREVAKIILWETLISEIVPLRDTRLMELIDEWGNRESPL